MSAVPDPTRTAADLWPAPVAGGPVRATVRVPGSKSVTNRALVLAALADEPDRPAPPARRPRHPADGGSAGARWAPGSTWAGRCAGPRTTGATWRVAPAPCAGRPGSTAGWPGRCMRFVPPVAALADGDVSFDGDPPPGAARSARCCRRCARSACAVDAAAGDLLPFTVHGRGGVARRPGRGGRERVQPARQRPAAGRLRATTPGSHVTSVGPPVPSLPHVQMTLAMLAARGVAVGDRRRRAWLVGRRRPARAAVRSTIEADLSNALPFAAAALVTGGRVRGGGVPGRLDPAAGGRGRSSCWPRWAPASRPTPSAARWWSTGRAACGRRARWT